MPNILVLSPHTDDAELGAGGSMARLLYFHFKIWCVAFSAADNPKLEEEFKKAMAVLGIPDERSIIHNFPRRNFPTSRQAILQHLIRYRQEINPDWVFVPCSHDIHQDHQVITAEALRAFKLSSILGYELPWNNPVFDSRLFIKLRQPHIERKALAVRCYKSQRHRTYLDDALIYGLAKVRGTQIEQPYAEAFEVLRWIL